MRAELVTVAFTDKTPPQGPQFWAEPLSALTKEVGLKKILEKNPESQIAVFAIPSFRKQLDQRQNDLHSEVSERDAQAILEGLGLTEDYNVSSIRHGGSSVAAALSIAAKMATKQDMTVIIVGAEAISRASGLSTKDLVINAGRSVSPEDAIGKTMIEEVPLTLITAYALRESAVFEGLKNKPNPILRTGKYSTGSQPLSGQIHPEEVAASLDGSFLAVVAPNNSPGDETSVYIAFGNVVPKSGTHINWWEMPSKFNMAYEPVQKILKLSGLKVEDLHPEFYECFFVAVFEQTAALLGIDSIDDSNITQIYSYIENHLPLSILRDWASWGISSAKKAFLIWDKLHKENSINGKENALLIGNGGVESAIASILLTSDSEMADHGVFEESTPNMEKCELVTDKEYLEKKRGVIDMIAYQYPINSKSGDIKGSTFVRVVLKGDKNKVVITNLTLAGVEGSSFSDLTKEGKIGSEVELNYLDGKNSPIVAKLIVK